MPTLSLIHILRENRSTELPTTVYLRGGTYVLNKTFELTAEDGGTEEMCIRDRVRIWRRLRFMDWRTS